MTKKDILAFIESGAAASPRATPRSARRGARARNPRCRASTRPGAPACPRRGVSAGRAGATGSAGRPASCAGAAAHARDGRGLRARGADERDATRHRRAHASLTGHVRTRDQRDRGRHVPRRWARERLKQEFQRSYGVNPTYLAFVTKAAVETLKDWPWVNGELRGEKIVTRSFVNVGIAVSLEEGKGLIVPVIRNAQDLNLLGIARAIADVAERARTKKLMPDDVQGGTFTITNPGGYGTFHGTPVISQPQAAILGTYALVKRPWVVQDALGQDVIAIRPMMNITLTYDHRMVDGAYSGGFLRDLRVRLEAWDDGSA